MTHGHSVELPENMLKVTTHTSPELTLLVVEGRLVQAGISELTRVWLHARESAPTTAIEADLSGVTYVDHAAMELLISMYSQAVRLVGTGTMTRALIKQVVDAAALRGAMS